MNNTPLSQSYFFQFNQKEEVLIFFFTFLHTHTLPTRIYITSFLMKIYIYSTGSHFFCLSVLRHHLDFQNYVRASVVISVSKDDFREKNPFLHQSILSWTSRKTILFTPSYVKFPFSRFFFLSLLKICHCVVRWARVIVRCNFFECRCLLRVSQSPIPSYNVAWNFSKC